MKSCGGEEGDPIEEWACALNEANRTDVATDLLSPFNSGWVYLNLQHPATAAAYADFHAQMWLTTTVMDYANGLFSVGSVGFPGIQLDNANAPVTTYIPDP